MWAAAAYYPAPDIVLTACHFDQSFTGVGFYSEFHAPLVEEFRLLASMVLAVGHDRGATPGKSTWRSIHSRH